MWIVRGTEVLEGEEVTIDDCGNHAILFYNDANRWEVMLSSKWKCFPTEDEANKEAIAVIDIRINNLESQLHDLKCYKAKLGSE